MHMHEGQTAGSRQGTRPAVTGRRRLTGVLLLAVVGLAAPALTSVPMAGEARAETTSPASAAQGARPLARGSLPTRLRIPAIHVSSALIPLGLRYDGSLQVPVDAFTSGWFTGGPRPGQLGPAVIAGHVHWAGRWGVFEHLADMEYGDRIRIDRRDGSTLAFRVTRVSHFKKSSFPTELVYGNIDHVGLRLITCDGFSTAHHAYLDNVVVFAVLDPSRG